MKQDYAAITRATYQKQAHDYAKMRHKWRIWDTLKSDFAKLVKRGGTILDVGCGGGHFAEYFVKKGFRIVGIDFAPAIVRVARRRVPQERFFVQDMTKLSFAPRSFDGIWMSASLHHIPKRQAASVLRKVSAVLKPKGWVYVSVHMGTGEGLEVSEKFGKRVTRFFANYRPAEMKQMLSRIGFRKIESRVIRPQKYPPSATKGAQWLIVFAQKP